MIHFQGFASPFWEVAFTNFSIFCGAILQIWLIPFWPYSICLNFGFAIGGSQAKHID